MKNAVLTKSIENLQNEIRTATNHVGLYRVAKQIGINKDTMNKRFNDPSEWKLKDIMRIFGWNEKETYDMITKKSIEHRGL